MTYFRTHGDTSEIAVATNTHAKPAMAGRRTRRMYGTSRLSARTMEASITMRSAVILALFALAAALPAPAHAQYHAPSLSSDAIGEKYHVELAGSFWNPQLVGTVKSDQFGQKGDNLDFVTDLGFEQTRFKDLRIVLRPAKKHRFRIQYTPVEYLSETTLHREVIFSGQKFGINLPIKADFGWKVWRFGYEYDFVYKSRGFVGVLVEGRYTEFTASLESPITSEFTSAKAPLPAIGVVGRAYVAKNIALNFEVSGFKKPEKLLPDYQANYYDWDINGMFNLTNNVGVQVGWRRMTTFLDLDGDTGDFKFQGLWFGGAVRF
jgi:hypothetical protein